MPLDTLPQPPEPFESLIQEWARSLRSEGKSVRTIRGYTDAARWFHIWCAAPTAPPNAEDSTKWLEVVPPPPAEPDDVQPNHVRSWIAYRLETTSRGNANNNYRALQPWFAWLEDEDEVSVNPMAKLKPPHVPDQPPPVVSNDLMVRVLNTCEGKDFMSRRDEAIIRLFWDTGARLSEVANITRDDLDLKIDVIHVIGKGGKSRAIPFAPKTGKALGRYLRVRAKHPQADLNALWLSDRQRGALSDNGIKLMLRRRGQTAGVNDEIGRNLHAHLGRHAAAHAAKKAGMSDEDMMLIFGWTTAQMVARYGRSAATERAHETARKLRLGDRL